jgi:diguanylate cyclase (GGDEF)-like protein
MTASKDFFRSILDSVSEHIVVIDHEGKIEYVNEAWVRFSQENGCKVDPEDWPRVNYLNVCDASASKGESYAEKAAFGIRNVIAKSTQLFNLEYPCHSNREKRWFMMAVTPLDRSGSPYFAISHQNITQRKLAEERVLNLSRIDGLTNIPNRRYFDEFLTGEWKRCERLKLPISVAILDIDHFKLLNDHYGHPLGDECLVKIGDTLNKINKRPGDLFARYGGEEFAFVFANATTEQASVPVTNIVDSIRDLEIPNIMSPTNPNVTVSVGLATIYPDAGNEQKDLMAAADSRLYSAKHDGRDRIVST